MLEQARRERHSKARRAIGEATRLRRPESEHDHESAGGTETVPGLASPRGLPSRRTLLVLLAILAIAVVVVALVGGGSDENSPPLATNCATPAVVVATVGNSSALRYSITGPAEGTYVITIDAATAKVHGDAVELTPASATAVAIKQNLKDCKGDGALPSNEGPGHKLVIFRDGKVVARATIAG